MHVSVTYKKLQPANLAAVAAACSKNVVLFESTDHDIDLSMAPDGNKIQSSNAILCYILNFNPLISDIADPLLWEARYVRPKLYEIYRSSDFVKPGKDLTAKIENILQLIESKFALYLSLKLLPFELSVWGDLYLLLNPKSPYTANSSKLKEWFDAINQWDPLKRAVQLVLGDGDFNNIKATLKNIPYLPVHSVPEQHQQTNGDSHLKCSSAMDDYFSKIKYESMVYPCPKVPVRGARNILITSALPYVNNVPHLGNLIGSTLSADVFSRYCRIRGYNSLYVCGTDEYGTATEVKAAEEKTTPREICDRYHAIHADVYRWFNIDFDIFGRTSTDKHRQIVTDIFHDIYRGGYILEDSVEQLFCQRCEKFLADRYVEGVCPLCEYEGARGDQCDKCGKLINAVELKEPRCKICLDQPIVRKSLHLFLDLARIQPNLESFLENKMDSPDSVWSTNAKAITKAWLREGLKPRCITRDLRWGVPVPIDGFTKKVFYVWFDAVLGYISITASYTDEWKQWWLPNDDINVDKNDKCDIELFQFMAKDNVPFHSVIFPANLMATGRQWTLLRQLASVEYLNYENDKFSKSRGRGVFGLDAKDSGISADVWRFYLVSSRPESQDSAFMWDDFAARNNSELLNNLGNFVYRSLQFVTKFFDCVIPSYHHDNTNDDADLVTDINDQLQRYVNSMETTRFRDAAAIVLNISRLGNGYIQRNQPWVAVKKEDTRLRAGAVVSVAANVCVLLGVMLEPIMPTVSAKILDQCNCPIVYRRLPGDFRFHEVLEPGHRIGELSILFTKMEADFVQRMKMKFGTSN